MEPSDKIHDESRRSSNKASTADDNIEEDDSNEKEDEDVDDYDDNDSRINNVVYQLIKEQRWDDVLKRLQTKKGREEAKRGDPHNPRRFSNPYTIHFACRNEHDVPLNVIQELLDEYPDGTQKKNEFDQLPIHIALRCDCPCHIIKALIDAYPACLQQVLDGSPPIHMAAEYSTSVDVINLLYDSYPEGFQARDYYNDLPIHNAARCNANEDVVKRLFELYPGGIKEPNKNGDLPLHCAAMGNTSAVVRVLLNAYPIAVQTPDNRLWLPIHKACCRTVNLDIFRILYKAYPQSIMLTCPYRNFHEFKIYYLRPIDILAETDRKLSPEVRSFMLHAEEMYLISLACKITGDDSSINYKLGSSQKKQRIK